MLRQRKRRRTCCLNETSIVVAGLVEKWHDSNKDCSRQNDAEKPELPRKTNRLLSHCLRHEGQPSTPGPRNEDDGGIPDTCSEVRFRLEVVLLKIRSRKDVEPEFAVVFLRLHECSDHTQPMPHQQKTTMPPIRRMRHKEPRVCLARGQTRLYSKTNGSFGS